MELDETEFKASRIAVNHFVRSFDSWEAMMLFDADKNGTIHWLEACGYRVALRDLLLSKHDLNKNKRLEGAEREAALKTVASLNPKELTGFIPPRTKDSRPDKPGSIPGEAPEPLRNPLDDSHLDINERFREYDELSLRILATEEKPWASSDDLTRELATHGLYLIQDHDGDGVRTAADWDLFGRRLRESRRVDCQRDMQKAIDKYDVNANGRLDPEEIVERKKQVWFLLEQLFDRDQDGELDDDERREFESHASYRNRKLVEECDEDGDSLLNEAEYESLYRRGSIHEALATMNEADLEGLYGEYRSEYWWEFDLNKDEQLDDDEIRRLNEAFLKETKGKARITRYPFNPWDDTRHISGHK